MGGDPGPPSALDGEEAGRLIGVILAAGRGSRLLPLTRTTPKCLLHVAGKPMIHWQIEAMTRAGLTRVVVVTGFEGDQVREAVARYPSVAVSVNERWAETGTLHSLWTAWEELDGDMVVCHGDDLFGEGLILRLCEWDAPIVVGYQRGPWDAEAMKLGSRPGQPGPWWGKDVPADESLGELVGVRVIREPAADAMFEWSLQRESSWTASYMVALAEVVRLGRSRGVAVDVTGIPWCEVDTQADLHRAQELWAGVLERREAR